MLQYEKSTTKYIYLTFGYIYILSQYIDHMVSDLELRGSSVINIMGANKAETPIVGKWMVHRGNDSKTLQCSLQPWK